jgi:hypothetical protein
MEEAASGDPGSESRSWEHHWPRGKGAPTPGRVSYARNVETVRHEALYDRAEVKKLRRRVVAATRLELRAA